jgi:UDP-sugar diphosphatase
MQLSSDLVKAHDSVAIITFNKTRNTLVVVKQFRPAVYYGQICEYLEEVGADKADSDEVVKKFPPKNAITMELCAGIIDKDLSFIEIAREELIEECGYNVPVERLEEVIRFRSGVGTTGSLQVMYYCEVTDDDKVKGAGGGVDDELIDVHELTLDEAREMLKQGTEHTSPPAFLFGILWFLTNKAPKS